MAWMEGLTAAYALAGAVGVAAYLPQMWALWKDDSGSKNVPLTTWGLWGGQVTVYLIYAAFVNGDPAFIAIMSATFVATHLCLWLLVYNRFFRKLPMNRRATDPKPPVLEEVGDRY